MKLKPMKLKPIGQIGVDPELGIGSVPLGNKVKELIERVNLLTKEMKQFQRSVIMYLSNSTRVSTTKPRK